MVVDGEAQQAGGAVAEVDEVGSNEAEAGVEDEEVLQAEEHEEDLGVTEEVEVDSVVVGIVVVVALEAHDKILFNWFLPSAFSNTKDRDISEYDLNFALGLVTAHSLPNSPVPCHTFWDPTHHISRSQLMSPILAFCSKEKTMDIDRYGARRSKILEVVCTGLFPFMP